MTALDYHHSFKNKLAKFLARLLGTDLVERAAAIVTRIVYWLKNNRAGYRTRDGHKWILNSYNAWAEQFDWLSYRQIGHVIRQLERIGLLFSAKYYELKQIGFVGKAPKHFHSNNQSKFYRVNWEMLETMELPTIEESDPEEDIAARTVVEAICLQQRFAPAVERQHPKNSDESVSETRANIRSVDIPMSTDGKLQRPLMDNDQQINPNFCQNNNTHPIEKVDNPRSGGWEKKVDEVAFESAETFVNLDLGSLFDSFNSGEDSYSAATDEFVENEFVDDESIEDGDEGSERVERPNLTLKALLDEAEDYGVRITPPLVKLIRDTQIQIVKDAIAALKEARRNGNVKNPTGYLTEAIKHQWKSNAEKTIAPEEMELFNRWFPRARERGIVFGNARRGERMFVLVVEDNCAVEVPFLEMLEKYPLDSFD